MKVAPAFPGMPGEDLRNASRRSSVEARGLTLQYPDGTEAIHAVDLSIGNGELAFMTGPSGSGKTSLLQMMLGMYRPTGGSLTVLGHDMSTLRDGGLRRLRQQAGPVFQDFRLTAGRHALENVMAGMRFLTPHPVNCRRDALAALERVGLAGKAFTPVEHLSWGERQRVSIARAVARKPRLILADEPTGNLDRDNALRILALLASFRDRDTTVVITTHATHLIDDFGADVLLHIDGGRVAMERKGGAV
mgnify:FL=1